MQDEKLTIGDLTVSALFRLLGEAVGYYSEPDNVGFLGPWDRHVAAAIDDALGAQVPHPGPFDHPSGISAIFAGFQFGPIPDPWIRETALRGFGLSWLNPQPLPPGPPLRWRIVAGIADRIIEAAASSPEDEAARLVGHFVDDISRPGFIVHWGRPPKPNWWRGKMLTVDLLLIADRFEAASAARTDASLGAELDRAAKRLTAAAIDRLR